MLNSVQSFINLKIEEVTTIKKSWVDVFKTNKKNVTNEVLVRLIGSSDIKNLCGEIEVATFNFEVYIIGNKNRNETRDLMEQLSSTFQNVTNRNVEIETIRIKHVETTNQSFQFLESDDVVVNKFNLEIIVENK